MTQGVSVPRCLTVASSDSGGGAGIQADLKAFAAAGCYGTCAVVAVTAQNTVGVRAISEVPLDVIRAQLDAVIDDIGCDAAKTGALMSGEIIGCVAAFFRAHPLPLVVDPVLGSSSGRGFLDDSALAMLTTELLPLATVVTPNLQEAERLARHRGTPAELAVRIAALGARAVLITGGHAQPVRDHLFDGTSHVEIPQARSAARSTHGSGCTHSATLTAELAKGRTLLDAARSAATAAAAAIEHGFACLGAGDGPVDALHETRL